MTNSLVDFLAKKIVAAVPEFWKYCVQNERLQLNVKLVGQVDFIFWKENNNNYVVVGVNSD